MMFGLLTAKYVIFIENLEANKYIVLIQALVEDTFLKFYRQFSCNVITRLIE